MKDALFTRIAGKPDSRHEAAKGLRHIAALARVLAVALWAATLTWALPGALFVLMIAHHGVRGARATYLVDIAPDDFRAGYAAASNSAIGVLLLVSGLFGGALSLISPAAALAGFAAMAVIGAILALGLREAE